MIRNGNIFKLYARSMVIQVTRGLRAVASWRANETRYTRSSDKCNCIVDSNIGKGDLSLVLYPLHVCGDTHVRSHVSGHGL